MGLSDHDGARSWSIRPATAGDYEAIVEIWSAAGLPVRLAGREGRPAFLRQLARFPDLYLVASEGERVVGVVLGSHDQRKGWINRLAVLPEFRRRGIGAGLARACDEAIRAHGIEIVAALVEKDNATSAELFEKLGFRADVPARYYRKLSHPDA